MVQAFCEDVGVSAGLCLIFIHEAEVLSIGPPDRDELIEATRQRFPVKD